MSNPFWASDVEAIRPLCPWREINDESKYVDVGSLGDSYARFKAWLEASRPTGGCSIIVAGPEGCGKTSLIHRCAFWLRADYGATRFSRVEIVDLSQDGQPAASLPAKTSHLSSRLVDELRFARLFTESEQAQLDDRRRSAEEVLPFLSSLLSDQLIVVLLPEVELAAEVSVWSRLARPKLVLFVETSEPTIDGEGLADNGLVLQLRPLLEADVMRYVESRLMRKPSGGPSIHPQTVQRYIRERSAPGAPAPTITELQLVLGSVYGDAMRDGRRSVKYVDIAQFYVRSGRLR